MKIQGVETESGSQLWHNNQRDAQSWQKNKWNRKNETEKNENTEELKKHSELIEEMVQTKFTKIR